MEPSNIVIYSFGMVMIMYKRAKYNMALTDSHTYTHIQTHAHTHTHRHVTDPQSPTQAHLVQNDYVPYGGS